MKVRAKALPCIFANATLIKVYLDVGDGTKGYIFDRVFRNDDSPFFFRNLLERDVRRAVIDLADGKVGTKG